MIREIISFILGKKDLSVSLRSDIFSWIHQKLREICKYKHKCNDIFNFQLAHICLLSNLHVHWSKSWTSYELIKYNFKIVSVKHLVFTNHFKLLPHLILTAKQDIIFLQFWIISFKPHNKILMMWNFYLSTLAQYFLKDHHILQRNLFLKIHGHWSFLKNVWSEQLFEDEYAI